MFVYIFCLLFSSSTLVACSVGDSFTHDDFRTTACIIPPNTYTISTGLSYPIPVDPVNVNIAAANSGTVVLTGKTRIILANGGINLTISGISLRYFQNNSDFELIRVVNGGLELKSVVIGNPSSVNNVLTAPIRVKNLTVLTITDNCNFVNINNVYADDTTYGGVMNADSYVDNVKITISSSKFQNNSVENIVDRVADGYGGAFVISTYGAGNELTIDLCEFTDCKSTYYAGAFDIYSEKYLPVITIKNCSFTNSYSGRDSGAVWLQMAGPGIIQNTNFTNCTAINDGAGIYLYDNYGEYSGAVMGSNYTVQDCQFVGCVSVGETGRKAAGAAIFVESAGWISIERSTFRDCVTNAYHGHGGAISNLRLTFAYFSVKNCSFTGCIVDKDDSTKPAPYDDGGDGGAISIKISLFNEINIESCLFQNCSASNHGGSLNVEFGSLKVINSTFNNSVAVNGNGGSIYTSGVIVTVEKTKFINSTLKNASAKGVEIYSAREIIHYGSGNEFACLGNNDVIYQDVSLNLIVCEHKTISDLDCSAGSATFPVPSSLRTLFIAVLVLVLTTGLFGL